MSSTTIEKKISLFMAKVLHKDQNIHLAKKKFIQLISLKIIKNNCLSLNYSGGNSYLFANGTEIYKFKANVSETVASPLCLGNI